MADNHGVAHFENYSGIESAAHHIPAVDIDQNFQQHSEQGKAVVQPSSRFLGARLLAVRRVSYHIYSLRGRNKEPKRERIFHSASKIAQLVVFRPRGRRYCDRKFGRSNHE